MFFLASLSGFMPESPAPAAAPADGQAAPTANPRAGTGAGKAAQDPKTASETHDQWAEKAPESQEKAPESLAAVQAEMMKTIAAGGHPSSEQMARFTTATWEERRPELVAAGYPESVLQGLDMKVRESVVHNLANDAAETAEGAGGSEVDGTKARADYLKRAFQADYDGLLERVKQGDPEALVTMQARLRECTDANVGIERSQESLSYHHASKEEKAAAVEAAAECYAMVEGTGTGFEKLAKLLHGKSAEEKQRIRGAFNEHFGKHTDGRTLDDFINGAGPLELEPEHKAQLQAELSGNESGEIFYEFLGAKGRPFGHGTRDEAMLGAVEHLRELRKQDKEKAEALEKALAKSLGKESFDDLLSSELGGRKLAVARAMETGNQEDIDVAKLDEATHRGVGNTTDDKTVEDIMKRYAGKDAKLLKEAAQRAGKDLEKLVVADARSGVGTDASPARAELYDSILTGDTVGQAAGTIGVAIEDGLKKMIKEPGTSFADAKLDDKAMLAEFSKIEDPAVREQVLERLQAKGVSMEKLIQTRAGLTEEQAKENLEELKRTGHIKPETVLALAIKDDDLDLVKQVTTKKGEGGEREQMSKEEMAELATQFEKQSHRSLKEAMNDNKHGLHGGTLHDAEELLKGKPESPLEAMQRLDEDYEFHRGDHRGDTFAWSHFVDHFTTTGEVLDSDHDEVAGLRKRLEANGGLPANKRDEELLEELTGWHKADTKNYVEQKEKVADGTKLAVEGLVAVLGAAAGGGPLVAMLFAGGGALAGTAVEAGIEGNEFGLDKALGGLKEALEKMATAGVMKTEALSQLLDKVGKGGADLWKLLGDKGKVMEGILAEGLKEGGKGFLETFIAGMGKNILDGKSPVDPDLFLQSLTGALGGVAGGVAGHALEELKKHKIPGELLHNFLKKSAEMAPEKALEALKGEAGEEDKKALDALKTVLELAKGTAEKAEEPAHHDPKPGAPQAPNTSGPIKPDRIIILN